VELNYALMCVGKVQNARNFGAA